MTDLEITKLCAEAMGLNHRVENISVVFFEDGLPEIGFIYKPLHAGAQTMDLLERFHLKVQPVVGNAWCVDNTDDEISHTECESHELKRAICECVAKMWLSKRRAE